MVVLDDGDDDPFYTSSGYDNDVVDGLFYTLVLISVII